MNNFKWVIFFLFLSGCTSPHPKPYIKPENVQIRLNKNIVSLTATEVARKIRNKELSSVEVVDAYFAQIYEYNPSLNAVVILNEKEARARALAADEALARGKVWGPLHGVPITVKDHFQVKGLRTTNGYFPMRNNVSNSDDTIIRKLKEAGAIIIGKTNMPTFGQDYQTDNPIFGRTNNPWDTQRTPGGSTGGGAAAVAAGLTPVEIGSDGGGSIRVPAHFCGVFGLKTTENIVPGAKDYTSGEENFISSRHLLSFGPLSRSIQDLKLVFPIIAGPDFRDVDVPAVDLAYPDPKPLHRLRIAWTDYYPGIPVSKETKEIINSFVDNLKKRGVNVERIPDNEFEELIEGARQTWLELNYMETYGLTQPSIYRFLLYAFNWDEGVVFPFSYENYLKVLTKRDRLVSKMDRFISNWDAFLYPVSSVPTFEHVTPTRIWWDVHRVYEEPLLVDEQPYDYYEVTGSRTRIFNLTGNPVVVFPLGLTSTGLPIGIQVIGQRWKDSQLLVTAEQLFDIAGSYSRPGTYLSR